MELNMSGLGLPKQCFQKKKKKETMKERKKKSKETTVYIYNLIDTIQNAKVEQ